MWKTSKAASGKAKLCQCSVALLISTLLFPDFPPLLAFSPNPVLSFPAPSLQKCQENQEHLQSLTPLQATASCFISFEAQDTCEVSRVYCGSEWLCILPEATQQEWQSWDGDPPLPPGFCTAGALVSSPPPPFCLAENIYIMKADTVIVGTVKAEVPEGQGPVGPAGPELEEELETDYASHYPEQETEPPLGSCGDVMFSVEEEGKEDPLPTTVSDK